MAGATPAATSELQMVYPNESYRYALNELNGISQTSPETIVLRGDLDGIFPFCKPKNLGLEAISKCSSGLNQHPMIPPHTQLTCRLRLQDPLHLRLIDSQIADNMFFRLG